MKSSVKGFIAVLSAVIIFGCHEKEKIVQIVEEKPKDIYHVALCETLEASVVEMLAPSSNNKEKYPQLFSNSVQEKLILTKETDVYISYVTESASVASTLGYYTYTQSGPGSAGDVDKQIAFPHVSSAILTPGDSRRLGKFPEGTVIEFFVVIGGYSNSTVNYSKPTFWTNYAWNPSGERQHVLFREKKCNNVVMAFEDTSVSTGSDQDFNDIIFIISDNQDAKASSSFNTSAVPEM
jgi:hypothetical protein